MKSDQGTVAFQVTVIYDESADATYKINDQSFTSASTEGDLRVFT
jgi:hypothetical protein